MTGSPDLLVRDGQHSWLLEYIYKCRRGEIIVGHELLQEFDILEKHLADPNIRFELADAHKRIKFIESQCKHFEAPFAGKPFILMLFQKAFIEAIYSFKIYDEELTRWVRLIQDILFVVGRKNGKALALDTPIPTPNGWKTMGSLNVGDTVYDQAGKPTIILKTSDVFIGHKCYEVVFEDGETIIADEEHIWTVTTKSSRRKLQEGCSGSSEYFDVTTAQMAEDYFHVRRDGKGTEYKYRVPMQGAVQYSEAELPINPYLLGIWLGNGESSSARISVGTSDLSETLSLIEKNGGRIGSVKDDKSCKRVRVTLPDKCLQTELRKLGLIGNKHIPDFYLHASIHQRFELLKGLMDTDGYCDKRGQCEFTQKSPAVTAGMSELLSSLGIKHTVNLKNASINGKPCGQVFRITFFVDKSNSCFKMERKHNRLKDKLADRMKNKSIVRITETESVPTKCIGVASPSSLYLAGKKMTVTHNTPLIGAVNLAEFFCGPTGIKILCSSNDYEQADLMFQAMNAMREESTTLERVTRKTIKGIFFGNPKKPIKKGKYSYQNKGSIRKISAKTGAREGRNIGVGSVDETHELENDSSIMPIRQALSTQDEPLYFELTTEGFVNDGYLDTRIREARQVLAGDLDRPRWLIWMYTQDSEQEVWTNEAMWAKSNPGIGVIKKWSFLRQIVEEAKTNKSTRAFVLAKDFNIKQNNAQAWLTPDEIANPDTFNMEDFIGAFAIGAVDLSKTGDLTSARAIMLRGNKKYTVQQYFIPEAKLADLSGDEKKQYEEWIRAGFMTVSPGNENDFSLVTAWFLKLLKDYKIRFYKIGYDKWSAVYWVKEMEGYGFDTQRVSQDWGSMSDPMKLVEADLRSKLINYNNNPIDKYCLENTALKINTKAEIMPVKVEGKDKQKIDGAVTLIIASRVYIDNRSEFLELSRRG